MHPVIMRLATQYLHTQTVTTADVAWGVTRRKQQRPGIASNDNTMHVFTARSSADLVLLGLHCFLRLCAAGLIAVLIPGCCWAYSAFSV